MSKEIRLETPRVRLRRFVADDVALLLDLDGDPEVMRYLPRWVAPTAEAYREVIERYMAYYARTDRFGFWAAELRETGEFLGWFLLRPGEEYKYAAEVELRPGDVEVGYRLRRKFWGVGLATEVAGAMVRRALVEEGAAKIVAIAAVGNVGSWRVMEKIGMTRVGEYELADIATRVYKYEMGPSSLAPLSPEAGARGRG